MGTTWLGPDVEIIRINFSISSVEMAWLTQLATPSMISAGLMDLLSHSPSII